MSSKHIEPDSGSDDIELAVKKGLRTWPKGAGWPARVASRADTSIRQRQVEDAPQVDPEAGKASRKLAESQEAAVAQQADRQGIGVDDEHTSENCLSPVKNVNPVS